MLSIRQELQETPAEYAYAVVEALEGVGGTTTVRP
jgi:hypothetical protein